MRRTYSMLAMLGIFAMTVCGLALAQGETSTISGKVVSSSGTSLVVRTDDNVQMTFTLDGSSVLPDRMVPGDRVTVSYHVLEGGAYHAANVSADTLRSATAPTGTTGDNGQASATGANERMPKTASPLPILALIGALSIISALGLRMLSRQRA